MTARPIEGRVALEKSNCRFAVFSFTSIAPPTRGDSYYVSILLRFRRAQQKTTTETFQARPRPPGKTSIVAFAGLASLRNFDCAI
jgi:hypothetical protein